MQTERTPPNRNPIERERVEPGIYRRTGADGRARFEVSFRDSDGRQRRRTVEGGVKAARTALSSVKADLGRGKRVAPTPRLTFDVAADRWWDTRTAELRPATRESYRYSLTHLRRAFGRRRLDDIAPAAVAAYVARHRAAGYKGSTVRSHLMVMRQVIAFAQRRLGFAGADPVALLERGERPSVRGDERAKRVLAADELRRLLAAIPERHRLTFELAAETGARKGETLGLAWQDVNLDAATVTFEYQLDRAGRREPLKTARSRRCVEVTPQLAARLRAHKLQSARSGDHDLVFVTAAGNGHDHRNVLRVLDRAAKRTGLGKVTDRDGRVLKPSPTFHALRHTHGSALIAAGWDIEEVSARLGHADVTTTLREYTHAYDAARRSDVRRDRLAALYPESAPPAVAAVASIGGRA
ncbi:MAG: tyrosine-type recombinase/integrase [Solirubrobacteraceae bacterium]